MKRMAPQTQVWVYRNLVQPCESHDSSSPGPATGTPTPLPLRHCGEAGRGGPRGGARLVSSPLASMQLTQCQRVSYCEPLCKKRGITRDYTPFLLILQGMTLPSQGITLPPF